MSNFYIADWHYNHKNCLAFDNRPFTSIEQMNEALVERWNSVVKPGDTVYVLGDMFWCDSEMAISVLDSLSGRIFLIKGNHDRCHTKKFTDKFVKVAEYMEIKDNGRNVVLSHYPIPCFKKSFLRMVSSVWLCPQLIRVQHDGARQISHAGIVLPPMQYV